MRAIETALTLIMILLIFGVVLTATENSTDKVVRATETNNMGMNMEKAPPALQL